jgi:hypothetical protein
MRRLLILLALALLLPTAAQAANPVLAAAKRSAKAETTKLELQMTANVPGTPKVVMSGSGATSGQRLQLHVLTLAAGQRLAMDAIGLVEHGGYVMYMRSPAFESQLPAGKRWVRFDLQKAGADIGLDVSGLIGQSQTLAPLEHGLVSTRRLGTERIAGRPTTHYRAVVDLRRAALAVPAYAKQLATVERTTGVRLGRVTQEVWVGADGRIRRLRSTTPLATQGARGTTVQTLTFLAYDVPVAISAPARALVFTPPS